MAGDPGVLGECAQYHVEVADRQGLGSALFHRPFHLDSSPMPAEACKTSEVALALQCARVSLALVLVSTSWLLHTT